jgi:hypothetical protein
MVMIKAITESDLNDCLNVLSNGFEDGAIRFGQIAGSELNL